MDQETRKFAAQVLGTIAYEAGRDCIPALDPELTELYAPGVGNAPIIQAWIDGWKFADMEYCRCCGKICTTEPCSKCGDPLCQDCTPPFGGHVCEPD